MGGEGLEGDDIEALGRAVKTLLGTRKCVKAALLSLWVKMWWYLLVTSIFIQLVCWPGSLLKRV